MCRQVFRDNADKKVNKAEKWLNLSFGFFSAFSRISYDFQKKRGEAAKYL